MWQYIARRALSLLPVGWFVCTVVFLVMRVLPGDPVQLMLAGAEAGVAPPERIEELRRILGLNEPLHIQYFRFILRTLRGDFGESIRFRESVGSLVLEAAGHTIELALVSLVTSSVIGIPLGILAAIHKDGWADFICMTFAVLGISMPLFWLGQLLIFVFSIRLGWLPTVSGVQPIGLVLPAATLGLVGAGLISRLTRSSLIEVLGQDYIRTARAKGASERRIIQKHALKNMLIPVVTVAGLQFGNMLSGAVVTETVYSRPGLGQLLVKSILWKDYPLVQGAVLFSAVMYVLANLLVDIVYGLVDPRVRYD